MSAPSFVCQTCGTTFASYQSAKASRHFCSAPCYAAGRHGAGNPKWKGGRALSSTYIRRRVLDHPRADSWGYVDEHVLVAEAALGKHLPPGAIVHHRNEDPRDNRKENLVICQDRAYHALIHARMDALKKRAIAS